MKPLSCLGGCAALAVLFLSLPAFGQPANDNCPGAIAMTAGTVYTVDTTDATDGTDPTPSCSYLGLFGAGVWYTFTPAASGTVTVSACGSSFDTVLGIYTGSCGALSELACNDDSDSCGFMSLQSQISFSGTAGTTYYILAGGVAGDYGSLQIVATVSGGPSINLAPYQPAGWSDKIVVSKVTGTTTDDAPLLPTDTLYVDWAVANFGPSATAVTCYFDLYVDGVYRARWQKTAPFNANTYVYFPDYSIGTLAAGTHTIKIIADSTGVIPETNEADNEYTKTINIVGASTSTLTVNSLNPATGVTVTVSPADTNGLGDGTTVFARVYSNNVVVSLTAPPIALVTNVFQKWQRDGVDWTNNPATTLTMNADHTMTAVYGAPPSIRITPLTLTFSNAAAGFAAGAPAAPTAISAAGPPAAPDHKLIDPLQTLMAFTNGPEVGVIVNLTAPASRATTDFASLASLKVLQSEIKRLQQEVISTLPGSEVKVGFRYDNISAFSAQVTKAGLEALQAHPGVVSIEPVYQLQMHLAQGIPLMHAMTYRSNYNGAGLAVAICDTGIDYTHARLGGGGFPNSKVLGGYDFGDNDADPMPNTQEHGTACAGIAAGDLGTVGDYIGGVAYNAKLYALKISAGTSGSASSAAMAAAWDWCVTHRNDNPAYPIMVISTSFGGGRYYATCDADNPSMTTAANNAVAAGITVLASSGNDGYCDSIAWPACISSVVSVGAVYDASFGVYYPCINVGSCAPKTPTGGCTTGYYATDNTAPDLVTSYANMASFVTLLAPANQCYTLDIVGAAGATAGDYDPSFGGTSAACPYAAGAVAALQSAAKARSGSYLPVSAVINCLLTNGDNITDTKVAITKPRVNLERAINSLPSSGQSFRIYNDGPSLLTVSAITPELPAPWITLNPSTSLNIAGGAFQDIQVSVNFADAPRGQTTTRLLVASNDPTNSPYAGGVNIVVINGKPIYLSGMNWSNGVFRFVLNGPVGTNCVIQASSNLVNWVPLSTNTIGGGGTAPITDASSTNKNQRYYRAQVQ